MSAIPVIAIFDIGKTNKKVFLFDEQYRIRWEKSMKFDETTDDDGFPCEDIRALTDWIRSAFSLLMKRKEFDIRAVNFSAYGASLVHLDERGLPFLPLYNYLKPYPPQLKEHFYTTYGGEKKISMETASPVLENLNAGMQLYRLKYKRPELFDSINVSLHLPQYAAFILSGRTCSEITSIGCHTALWDFTTNRYHLWVQREGIDTVLAPFCNAADTVRISYGNNNVLVGTGLHDSSAALIPYLVSFHKPFVLLSTGTWCISLNPFNKLPLTEDELSNDCLLYMSYSGHSVKASRLFTGYEHEKQVKLMAEHFNKNEDHYEQVRYDAEIFLSIRKKFAIGDQHDRKMFLHTSSFTAADLPLYKTYEEAYHGLMFDIILRQALSTRLVIKETDVRCIFVDGGFSRNEVFMSMLASIFPQFDVYAASVPQASALGAALAIHDQWSNSPLPDNMIGLKKYEAQPPGYKI